MVVSKFYSRLEKLGLKKHKCSEEEIKYLESMNEIEQCDALNAETDFIIDRLSIKMKISFLVATILLFSGVFFLQHNMIWLFVISLLLTGSILIVANRLRSKIQIQKLTRIIFDDVRSGVSQKMFR